ncbi:PIG-L deacetylase family protein [Erysipelothrix urinaevulpis]|uniref:PIG-L deacetylase family protein n=1 Tax=Erysipelothrix urinaevulpis TaxID=2683717 RepID=UPI0013585BF7|nr:PIG-L family deacetylase [Erysipelothrix urinaevulpis]
MNKKYQRIVSIGAHSLDAELMGGPLMIKYALQGSHCTFVHVTKGRLENPDATVAENDAYVAKITEENKNVAKTMHCDSYAMGYLSSELPSEQEFVTILKEYLIKEKVDLVITHARGTLHARHYYTYDTVTQAVRQLNQEGYDINLLYGENCEDLIGFIPTLYVSMSQEVEETWFKGLANYTIFNGEINDVPYPEYYKTMGIVRRFEVGSKLPVKAYMHAGLLDKE